MPPFNFFDDHNLVRPDVTERDAERIARELFGVRGSARELGSQQDRNFRIHSAEDGPERRYLLKFDNAVFGADEINAQTDAMTFLSHRGLRVPQPRVGLDGSAVGIATLAGRAFSVRMMSYLDGDILASRKYLPPAAVAALGSLAGLTAKHLAEFTAPGVDRMLQWDLRNAGAVIGLLAPSVGDEARRARVVSASISALEQLERVEQELRVQPIHGDITDDNVVCTNTTSGSVLPDGVIDFGDLASGWLVAELAVTAASLLTRDPHDPFICIGAIQAFDAIMPLTDAELVALWPLMVLRGAVLVVSGEHQAGFDGDNDYAVGRMDTEWAVFAAASGVGWDIAEAMIRTALRPVPQRSVLSAVADYSPMVAAIARGNFEMLDFGVDSAALDDGVWREPGIEERLAGEALTRRPVAIAPYGQHRLTRTPALSTSEPFTVSTGTEIFTRPGTAILSPVNTVMWMIDETTVGFVLPGESGSTVVDSSVVDSSVVDLSVVVSGIVVDRAPGTVQAGDTLGHAVADSEDGRLARVVVRMSRANAATAGRVTPSQAPSEAPPFVRASTAAAWRTLTGDPASVVGVPATSPVSHSSRVELRRREAVMAGAQERYFRSPPRFERGWAELLIDAGARSYVDLVNNVASIGHSHPGLTRAVSRQLTKLNTNSRFLYGALADLSERIISIAPHESLDTVLLVNSGSEAVDLALRLAQTFTGRGSIVAVREGYHGWTSASDAVSTSLFDNPDATMTRASTIHIVDNPNVYRGVHRGPDAAQRYAADVITLLDSANGPAFDLAAFICEPIFGNAGGVTPPPGYLAEVYAAVRERGGVCIADEVQVGYGRLGTHFWGSQQQGVLPDIVTMAKAMGNGYPIGAVLTRRDIAESLALEGNFFSSSGGSPVSCVAGLAVLDAIHDEHLQANALAVGRHLMSRLHELALRHPLIGTIHGSGLYLGVELVRDRETRKPATEEAEAICERLLLLGVITQPASERQNVLKIKPPLCLTLRDADFFIDQLDEVLTSGW